MAQQFGVSLSTVGRVACDYDWLGRAEYVDEGARAVANKHLVARRAVAMITAAEAAIEQVAKFERRLPDAVRDDSGVVVPNPHRLEPSEISVADFCHAAELLILLTTAGGGSDENAPGEPPQSLEELRRALADLADEAAQLRCPPGSEQRGIAR